MSDFKDRMIEAVERGWTDEAHAYEYVRESYADAADLERKRRQEAADMERYGHRAAWRCPPEDVDESGGVR